MGVHIRYKFTSIFSIVCSILILFGNFALRNADVSVSKRQQNSTQNQTVHQPALADVELLNKLRPLKAEPYIMLWRPQKVGSSTLLSLLMSIAYRYNIVQRRKGIVNQFCAKIATCDVEGSVPAPLSQTHKHLLGLLRSGRQRSKRIEELQEGLRYQMSNSHQMCNLPHNIVSKHIKCAFEANNTMNQQQAKVTPALANVKEIFIVRDPLSRMISVYYFWGELYVMNHIPKAKAKPKRLGLTNEMAHEIKKGAGAFFTYHGNESSAPPYMTAVEYARDLPLGATVRGRPTYTWAAFADNVKDAVQIMGTDRVMTVVTERLDESLVVLSHFMNWTLADVVVTMARKALSSHPKHGDWPPEPVAMIRARLEAKGEYDVYRAANVKLTQRMEALSAQGVDVEAEVALLRAMRNRVTKMCLTEEYLERYRRSIGGGGFPQHQSSNKLRDVADSYIEKGHSFSFNGELLYSFDVCGPCEAHAMLVGLREGLASSVDAAPTLKELRTMDHKYTSSINFIKCP